MCESTQELWSGKMSDERCRIGKPGSGCPGTAVGSGRMRIEMIRPSEGPHDTGIVGRRPLRRVPWALVVVGLAAAVALTGAPGPAGGEERAPSFQPPARGGVWIALEEFRGKKAVVLFFQEGPG